MNERKKKNEHMRKEHIKLGEDIKKREKIGE
jgi:hypothetical protein